jgi:hypothetical protein
MVLIEQQACEVWWMPDWDNKGSQRLAEDGIGVGRRAGAHMDCESQ